MFGTLIESRPHRQLRRGGSLVSIVAHGAIIAAAVGLTAHSGFTAAAPPKVEIVNIGAPTEPPPPAERPVTAHPATTTPSILPTVPAIQVPTIIPSSIPPIDMNATPTRSDFNELRGHGAGPGCAVVCPTTGDDTTQSLLWTATEMRMAFREPPVPPRYPERLRMAGVEGSVLMKFVVDTTGRVDPASVEVVSSTHELFTAAVRETLGRLRFNPAMVGNRKVRAAAMMPFQFTLH
jgi:periplasmic protein TonB